MAGMSSSARARSANAMVGASSLCVMAAGVWVISPDMRTMMASAMGDPATHVSAMVSDVLNYGDMLLRLARHHAGDNGPLAGFGVVAVFLTILMARS